MKNLLFIFLLYPFLSFAQQDWEYAGKDSDNASYYVKDIVKKDYSQNILFWVKIVEVDKIVKTKKGSINKKGAITMQKLEVNCREKTIEITSSTKYNSEGKLISSDRGSYVPEPAVPESIGEMILLKACSLIN
ncbi:surface-adhesin E family protein [Chryseobacterium candidae]|uniref:Surface-adhesin protein E-like domain-containing protein n=1 Tax=Chryseobacterium candidae TaxID=1978493 RepID=A0ABY2R8J3_9FLAO|nr:surface-adhesin E family protein [Chryseobacterium candidae]THV61922.1 hypothetical protein EK417_08415 [Chryseobacterium candidae]